MLILSFQYKVHVIVIAPSSLAQFAIAALVPLRLLSHSTISCQPKEHGAQIPVRLFSFILDLLMPCPGAHMPSTPASARPDTYKATTV